ncbi:MAG: hypothetical protein ACK5T1_15855, partial [Betaproteobacteria bacterium]
MKAAMLTVAIWIPARTFSGSSRKARARKPKIVSPWLVMPRVAPPMMSTAACTSLVISRKALDHVAANSTTVPRAASLARKSARSLITDARPAVAPVLSLKAPSSCRLEFRRSVTDWPTVRGSCANC